MNHYHHLTLLEREKINIIKLRNESEQMRSRKRLLVS